MNIKTLFTAISLLISIIPGLSQLSNVDLLPNYWNHGNVIIGVSSSVLCFVLVLILYSQRNFFKQMSNRKAITTTIICFMLFLFSIISFASLSSYCLIPDKKLKAENETEYVVFFPIFLAENLNEIVSHPAIGSREAWVNGEFAGEGKYNIDERISTSKNGIFNLQITMVVFIMLYLSIFVFLISSVLTIGFHIAPAELTE